jgi:YHS domain-containing protein
VFRAIFYLIAAVIAISAIRGVIGIFARAFSDFAVPPETAGSSKPAVPVSEALQKDPVCGAFVAPSAAVALEKGNLKLYFCSVACRDRFSARPTG